MFFQFARDRSESREADGRVYNYFGTRTRNYLGTREGPSRIYTGYNNFPILSIKAERGSAKHRARHPGLPTASPAQCSTATLYRIRTEVDAGHLFFAAA